VREWGQIYLFGRCAGQEINLSIYTEVDKVAETEEYVEYTSGRNLDVGLIRMDKDGESIRVLKRVPSG